MKNWWNQDITDADIEYVKSCLFNNIDIKNDVMGDCVLAFITCVLKYLRMDCSYGRKAALEQLRDCFKIVDATLWVYLAILLSTETSPDTRLKIDNFTVDGKKLDTIADVNECVSKLRKEVQVESVFATFHLLFTKSYCNFAILQAINNPKAEVSSNLILARTLHFGTDYIRYVVHSNDEKYVPEKQLKRDMNNLQHYRVQAAIDDFDVVVKKELDQFKEVLPRALNDITDTGMLAQLFVYYFSKSRK